MSAPPESIRAVPAWLRKIRVRSHFVDRRFWVVQSIVVVVTVLHGIVEYAESNGALNQFSEGLHNLPVELYVLPVVLAGWWFGLEGGVLTGLLSLGLSIPNLVLFHSEGMEWLGELGANAFVIGVGILVASMVEREARARREAVGTSRRLETLHSITSVLNRTAAPRTLIGDILDRLQVVDGVKAAGFIPNPMLPDHRHLDLDDPLVRGRTLDGLDGAEPRGVAKADVLAARTTIGTLYLDCGPAGPCRENAELLAHVAQELGFALENFEMQERERAHLQAYARAMTDAEEHERRRIARDLHDGAAQTLVLLVRGLGRLHTNGDADDVADLRELARHALQSIRRITWALRPALLDDLGLVPAIESFIDHHSRRVPWTIDFEVSGLVRRLSDDAELAAFRIVQETLSNITRHADPERTTVELVYEPDTVRLRVSDDGRGFDIDAFANHEMFGLTGMRERAESVGGDLEIESRPGRGTSVVFSLTTAAGSGEDVTR